MAKLSKVYFKTLQFTQPGLVTIIRNPQDRGPRTALDVFPSQTLRESSNQRVTTRSARVSYREMQPHYDSDSYFNTNTSATLFFEMIRCF